MNTQSKWIILLTTFLASFICLTAAAARAQDEPKPGDTGITTGTVTEITSDYILIQTPADERWRYWFKWADTANAKPDPETQSATAKLKADDFVAIKWSFNGRRQLESVSLTTPPPPVLPKPELPPAAVGEAAPSTVPAMSKPAGLASPTNAAGEAVNAMIDNLMATASRILELPLFALLTGVAAIGVGLALTIDRLSKSATNSVRTGRLRLAMGVFIVFAIVFITDRKIARLQDAVAEVRTKMTADAGNVLSAVSKGDNRRRSFLFDAAEASASLTKQFGEVNVRPLIYDEATDVVQVHINSPLAQVYLAAIDLRHPAVEIKLGYTADHKTLTSQFARDTGCTVAINGEAGTSPAPGSGLGVWRGDMVQLGKVVSNETPGIPRPFLSFDQKNRVTFRPAASPDRTLSAAEYNLIWGRLDVLLNGQIQSGGTSDRQPRTAMAINQAGTILYLMVVDGRQPRYSMGFTRAEAGQFLKAFGARDGMLCDEGGSSSIYLKQFGGISNIPSDNQGQERPTYTHFGVAMRSGI